MMYYMIWFEPLAKIRNSQLADGYRLPEIPIAAAVAAL